MPPNLDRPTRSDAITPPAGVRIRMDPGSRECIGCVEYLESGQWKPLYSVVAPCEAEARGDCEQYVVKTDFDAFFRHRKRMLEARQGKRYYRA